MIFFASPVKVEAASLAGASAEDAASLAGASAEDAASLAGAALDAAPLSAGAALEVEASSALSPQPAATDRSAMTASARIHLARPCPLDQPRRLLPGRFGQSS